MMAKTIIFASAAFGSSFAFAGEQHRFALSHLAPTDIVIMKAMLPIVIKECAGLTDYMEYLSADRASVNDFEGDFAIDYNGSATPWTRRYEFSIRVSDSDAAAIALPDPRWAGHRFSVMFSLDPPEIFAEKSVGEGFCDTLEESARHAPLIARHLESD